MSDRGEISEVGLQTESPQQREPPAPQVVEPSSSEAYLSYLTDRSISKIIKAEKRKQRPQAVADYKKKLQTTIDELTYPEVMKIRRVQLGLSPNNEAEELMSNEAIESAWYKALYIRDCLGVMYLLEKKPELLIEGWAKSDSKVVEESSGWLGRTALHVGASRGCVDLVLRVVGMNSYNEAFNLSSLLSQLEGGSNLEALAMALLIGNQDIVKILMEASFYSDANPYNVPKPLSEGRKRRRPERERRNTSEDSKLREELGRLTVQSILHKAVLDDNVLDVLRNDMRSEDNSQWVPFLMNLFVRVLDINFLPWEEYLLHFAFASSEFTDTPKSAADNEAALKSKVLQDHILDAMISEEATAQGLLKLFSYVKDGCGRTVMHYAIDHGTFLRFVPLGWIPDLWGPLVQNVSRDAVGRTPLQYVVARARAVNLRQDVSRDVVGRTALQDVFARARARQGASRKSLVYYYDDCVSYLLDSMSDINAHFNFRDSLADGVEDCLDMGKTLARNGFTKYYAQVPDADAESKGGQQSYYVHPYTAPTSVLHIAIMGKNLNAVRFLLGELPRLPENVEKLITTKIWVTTPTPSSASTELDVLQLAVIVGDLRILKLLLEHDGVYLKILESGPKNENMDLQEYRRAVVFLPPFSQVHEKAVIRFYPSAFHIAAGLGDLSMIEMFLACKDFDPLILSKTNKTALHYCATDISDKTKLVPMLWDFVDGDDVRIFREDENGKEEKRSGLGDGFVEDLRKRKILMRQGCVDRLLQSGIEMFAKSDAGTIATPGTEAPLEFVQWWYDKALAETQQEQAKINAAGNAISVTAALVATASYVGPLQPPLGYDDGSSRVQVTNLSVQIFFIFNTLSFYFAVASIIFSLIPSISLPQESTLDELLRARRFVRVAVGLLGPSIIFILFAFGSASIGVIPSDDLWLHGGLTAIATIVGGLLCLAATLTFILRFVRLVFYKKQRIRKLYSKFSDLSILKSSRTPFSDLHDDL